jgi:hypothetical protein
MATTTLVFAGNPFATAEPAYQLQQAERIDDKRHSVVKLKRGSGQVQTDVGTGAIDDLFDNVEEGGPGSDTYAGSSIYDGPRVSVYA